MKKLTIYFTSDTHGYLYNTDFFDASEKPMGLYGMRFPKDGDTLIIDGGDTIQGSPLTYYCHEKGLPCPAAAAMNDRGYDYVTLGNHDFNYGQSWLRAHLNTLNARCLCANVQDEQGQLPIAPYAVQTLASGLRVGLFGIVTDWVNRWEQPEHLQGLQITSPLEAACKAVEALKKEGVDLVIGIYHGGLERDPGSGALLSDTDENIACRLCEELPIDLLLTGHQHIGMANQQWHGTHIVQTPCNATRYIRVQWDEQNGFLSELIAVPAQQRLTAEQQALRKALDHFLDTPIGKLSEPLWPGEKLDMALNGSPIADFFNRVQLWASGADISCAALANEVRGFDSAVTVRDVVASYPYANTLVVLEITGEQLKTALEQCARYFDVAEDGTVGVSDTFLKPKAAHYNYDYFTGIRYTIDLNRPAGNRVTAIERAGRTVGPTERLTLCMCNYRATGFGHFEVYLQCERLREIQTEISELILNYLKAHPRIEIPKEAPYRVIMPKI